MAVKKKHTKKATTPRLVNIEQCWGQARHPPAMENALEGSIGKKCVGINVVITEELLLFWSLYCTGIHQHSAPPAFNLDLNQPFSPFLSPPHVRCVGIFRSPISISHSASIVLFWHSFISRLFPLSRAFPRCPFSALSSYLSLPLSLSLSSPALSQQRGYTSLFEVKQWLKRIHWSLEKPAAFDVLFYTWSKQRSAGICWLKKGARAPGV